MKADAVFEGGGVKGIAFVGAICCLEEYGYQWEKVAGTSAGAIVASLLSVGFTGKELKDIVMSIDYTKFLDKSKLLSVPLVGRSAGLLKNKGLYTGKFFENWIGELLKAKGKTKFKDVSINGVSRLKLIASDITKKSILILPDDLDNYGINPMEFDIAKAIRMSISIPFYFNPVKLNYNGGSSLIVDGGILSKFPIWIFDVDGTPRWPTVGFKLVENKKSHSASGKTDIVSYLLDIVDTVIDRDEEIFVEGKHSVRTISIPTHGIKTTQFNLNYEHNKLLFDEGYKQAKEFVKRWNFGKYIKMYRNERISRVN